MDNVSTWLGAGVVTAGVSAALLAGAAVASADTDSGSDSGGTSSSSPAGSAAKKEDSKPKPDKPDKPTTPKSDTPKTDKADTPDKPDSKGTDKPDEKGTGDTEVSATAPTETKPVSTGSKKKTAPPADTKPADTKPADTPPTDTKPAESKPADPKLADTEATESTPAEPVVDKPEPAVQKPTTTPTASLTTAALTTTRAAVAEAPPPAAAPSLLGFVGSVIGSVVVNVGSVAVTALQAVEALAAGPPVLPPGSTVTVRDSWITLGNGQRIAANWYYPEGDTPPDRMILLQHGLLALGPMYSFTAAKLAQQTGSIVVTPSITSNLFLGDDHWLGGTGMASEIADLFTGDRTALTQSALDAGFATRYGLDPADARLPEKFALAGHSLGGNLVSAAAGFLAENGGADNLVGVIALDGVPFPGTVPTAMAKLADYENSDGGHYIPVREIGAPWNPWNSISTINEDLSAARPDHFNGVVLTGGVHMDSMQGGNPLIQFAAYVAAGFPQPQNPPAVQQLAVTWLDEWFGGDPFVGDDRVPGSTFVVDTPAGPAEATVIGTPPAARLGRSLGLPFPATAPTTIPSPDALPTTLVV